MSSVTFFFRAHSSSCGVLQNENKYNVRWWPHCFWRGFVPVVGGLFVCGWFLSAISFLLFLCWITQFFGGFVVAFVCVSSHVVWTAFFLCIFVCVINRCRFAKIYRALCVHFLLQFCEDLPCPICALYIALSRGFPVPYVCPFCCILQGFTVPYMRAMYCPFAWFSRALYARCILPFRVVFPCPMCALFVAVLRGFTVPHMRAIYCPYAWFSCVLCVPFFVPYMCAIYYHFTWFSHALCVPFLL